MSEPTAEQTEGPQPTEKDGIVYVPLKLAHPLSKDQAAHVQAAVVKPYNVGNTIRVTREWGLAIIEGGFAQVDPIDRKAVRAALFLNAKDQPLTSEEIAALLGDAGTAVPARVEAQQSAADAPAGKPAAKAPAKSAS